MAGIRWAARSARSEVVSVVTACYFSSHRPFPLQLLLQIMKLEFVERNSLDEQVARGDPARSWRTRTAILLERSQHPAAALARRGG